MRTLVTLLLLVCFAWSQALAADCPTALAPQGQPGGDPASASTHHGHHGAPSAPADRHGTEHDAPAPAQHAAGACTMVMACGATAAPAAPVALAAMFLPQDDGTAVDRGSYASPSLSTDPPPPRAALCS